MGASRSHKASPDQPGLFDDLKAPPAPSPLPDASFSRPSPAAAAPTLAALASKHRLSPPLKLTAIESRDGQTKMADKILSDRKNFFIWSPTNSGKTYVAMTIGAKTLAEGGRVFVVTPQLSLIDQGMRDAKTVLDVEGVAGLSGDATPQKRDAAYLDSANKIFFLTPQVFANDSARGCFSPGPKDLVFFDEAHLILQGAKTDRKNFMWQALQSVLSKAEQPRCGFLSATPAPDLGQLDELLYLAKADFHRMETQQQTPVTRREHKFHLDRDPDLFAACNFLEGAARKSLEKMILNLKAVAAASHNRPFREQLQALQQSCGDILSGKNGEFVMPSYGAEEKLRTQYDAIRKDFDARTRNFRHQESVRIAQHHLGQVISAMCAFGSILHSHALLATMSRFAFLDFVASNLLEARLGMTKGKVQKFRQSLYGEGSKLAGSAGSQVMAAFNLMASGTPYAAVLQESSGTALAARLGVELPPLAAPKQETLPANKSERARAASIEARRRRLLDALQDKFAASNPWDHLKEPFMQMEAAGRIKQGQKGLVFVNHEKLARFLARRFNAAYPEHRALHLAGKKHMSSKAVEQGLQEFQRGEAQVLFMTSVGELGLHIPGTDFVICYTPTAEYDKLVQRIGRVTPANGGGTAMNLISAGTQDEFFAYSAESKRKNRERQFKLRDEPLPFP